MADFIKQDDPLPSGAITMFHGDPADIPEGWAICDGLNGTPNLLDTFPRSIPNGTTDPGTTGGEKNKTLTTSQLPSHSHTTTTDPAGSHKHTTTHDSRGEYAFQDPRTNYWEDGNTGNGSFGTTSTDGAHSHTVTLNNSGGGQSFDNQPAYLNLIFIQKL